MTDPVFFRFRLVVPPTLGDVLAWSGARPVPGADPGLRLHGIAALEDAGAGALTLAASARDLALLPRTRAAACFVSPDHAAAVPPGTVALVTDAPARDFARAAARMIPEALRPASVFGGAGVSPGVSLHPSARLEADVVADPGVVIGARAEIGGGTLLGANSVVGPDVRIGRGCAIGAGATLMAALLGDRVQVEAGARVGGDGLAFRAGPSGVWLSAPQIGRVILQDDVHVGANAVISRGALRDTVIGEGTKVGAQASVAQDVRVGRHCLLGMRTVLDAEADVGDFSRITAGDASGVRDDG